MPRIDLCAVPQALRVPEARRLAAAEAARPFDLAQGPVFRAILLQLAAEDHVSLVTMHHISSDGWSVGVFVRELGILYQAFAAGRLSPLPELRVQYADYAAWQRSWLDGDTLDAELAVWSNQLHGAPPRLELPTDRRRPARPSRRGTSERFTLSSDLSQSLRATGQSRGATPFMTFLAIWQLLLSRLSGQDDLCVGTPIAGRNQVDLEPLIGFFVNTLVLRTNLSDAPTFVALLAKVREICLEAHVHQAVPFEKLVERMAPQRSLDHTPLFQVMFALQNTSTQRFEVPGLTAADLGLASKVEKFDLSLTIWEEEGIFHGALSGSTDLFDRSTITRMIDHLVRLLESVAAAPQTLLSDLTFLTPAERHQLLVEWNDTAAARAEEATLHGLFEAQVARSPHALAVVFEGDALTYAELDRSASRLALRLRRLGVGPEMQVGLCAENSLELVVGMMGILKAGSGFVPLDPDTPTERLERIIGDSGLAALATDRRHLERAEEIAGRCLAIRHLICLDGEERDLEPRKLLRSAAGGTAEGIAYVIFTSGSTGTPKGVPITHENLVPLLLWSREVFGLGEHTRVLQSLSYAFDFGVFEILTTLLCGGSLFLRGGEERSDVEGYLEEIRRHGINTLHTTPSFFRAVAVAAAAAGERLDLEVLHLGGEALGEGLVEEAFAVIGARCRLFNGYGPTEAAVNCALFEVGQSAGWRPRGLASVPIGRPSAASRLYVLDRWMQPVPVMMPGELLVGGVGLSRGYLNRPDLTAARFVPDPFGGPGARLYRTGDLVRYLPDGEIEYLGRIDRQVKLRGFRIELGEIETALLDQPEIQEAVVTVREDRPGDCRLVAYVTGDALETAVLRQRLCKALPAYMVPALVVWLDMLPLNLNGKVDRSALPAPSDGRAGSITGSTPQGAIEEILAAIWLEVLGCEHVGSDDNFFDLGGHSLLGTRVTARLREAFGVDVPLRAVFEQPTLAALAREIGALLHLGGISAAPPMTRAPRDGALPASFAQQRLWFLGQLHPGSTAYNVPIAQHLVGPLNVWALQASLAEMVRRHETLRTTFAEVNGKVAQVITPLLSWWLPVIDLSALPEAVRSRAARNLAVEERLRPFDLWHGPIFRVSLLHLAEDDHVILVTMHHISTDGWSIGIFVRELRVLYEAFAAGHPSPLPELPLQYTDYAIWQRNWLQGDVLDTEIAYWREQLRGAPPLLEIPTDRPRPVQQSDRGARLSLPISGELSCQLAALSRKETCTPFMTLLAAFCLLLSRDSGQEDLVVGMSTANRTRAEIEGLIGFFINSLPLRINLSGLHCFRGLLKRVREISLGAFTHQELPLEKLVEAVRPVRSSVDSPLFRIAFGVQNMPTEGIELPGLELGAFDLQRVTARFDLTIWVAETKNGFCVHWTYSTDLFEESSVRRMHQRFVQLLESIVEHPDAEIDTLNMLSAVERKERENLEKAKETSRHAKLLQAQPKKLRLTRPNH